MLTTYTYLDLLLGLGTVVNLRIRLFRHPVRAVLMMFLFPMQSLNLLSGLFFVSLDRSEGFTGESTSSVKSKIVGANDA